MQSDSSTAAANATGLPNSESTARWLHPLSPIFDVLANIQSVVIPLLFGGYAAVQGKTFGFFIATAVIVISIVVSAVRYVTLRYQICHEDLVVDEGLIFRKHRTIPVQRIQNIDLKQNILHRMLKVAEVRIETASGNEPEAILRVLSLAEINQLRDAVSLLRQGPVNSVAASPNAEHAESTIVGNEITHPAKSFIAEPEAVTIAKIPIARLLLAGLLSNRGLVLLGVLFGLFFQRDWFAREGPVINAVENASRSSWLRGLTEDWLTISLVLVVGILAGIGLIKLFSMAWYVLRFYGYRLELVQDDLRIRCGLFTQLSASIPRKRIQLISIQRSYLQRKLGMATIRIETAGGAGKSEDASASIGRRWFMPILSEAELPGVMTHLRPGFQWQPEELEWKSLAPRASARMRRVGAWLGLMGSLAIGFAFRPWGFLLIPLAVPLTAWFAGRRAKTMRYARSNEGIFFRSGVVLKKYSMTFMDKAQAVSLHQSPFDRRWAMATLAVDTAAAGPADHRISVRMLDSKFAELEFRMLAAQACAAQAAPK